MIRKMAALEQVKEKAICVHRVKCGIAGSRCMDCEDFTVTYKSLERIIGEMPEEGGWRKNIPEKEGTYLVKLENGTADVAIYTSAGFCPWYAYHFDSCPPEWNSRVIGWKPIEEEKE